MLAEAGDVENGPDVLARGAEPHVSPRPSSDLHGLHDDTQAVTVDVGHALEVDEELGRRMGEELVELGLELRRARSRADPVRTGASPRGARAPRGSPGGRRWRPVGDAPAGADDVAGGVIPSCAIRPRSDRTAPEREIGGGDYRARDPSPAD